MPTSKRFYVVRIYGYGVCVYSVIDSQTDRTRTEYVAPLENADESATAERLAKDAAEKLNVEIARQGAAARASGRRRAA